MSKSSTRNRGLDVLALVLGLSLLPGTAGATIIGATGTSFNFTARADAISTSDGDSLWMWGYALCSNSKCGTSTSNNNNRMQYPGPTLIVDQGATVTITLHNQLPVPVSMIFPGQTVAASGGTAGLLTREAQPADASAPGPQKQVTYTFTASQPGTYTYYSGTRPDLQVEMGLVGTLIVRPTGFSATTPCPADATTATSCRKAYNDPSTGFDREYLFVFSDADPLIHQQVAFASSTGSLAQIQDAIAAIDMSARHPTDWFENGRNFPDTLTYPNPPPNGLQSGYPTTLPVAEQFPTQPYNEFPQMYPGEKVLIRMVGAGLDLHPFHTHGQNHVVIARDARLLSTHPDVPAPVPDMGVSDYTTTTVPGETVDAMWGPWTGAKLGWDVYGHTDPTHSGLTGAACTAPLAPNEDINDHCKPIPVTLPSDSVLTFGIGTTGFYSGSPYLGTPAALPPLNPDGTVHVQDNPLAGLSFMWHSHNERELTTNDIFPGGMATMALVVPPPSICPTGNPDDCNIW